MRKIMMLTAASAVAMIRAFDNKPGWKVDADGKLELDADGNPQYVNAAGQAQSVRGDTIASLNAEAKSHRTRAETAEKALEPFKDIDPEAAKKAIETVGKLDAKALIDAGEVDRVKDAMRTEFQKLLEDKDKEIGELRGSNDAMTIDKVFDGSEFVRENIAVPVGMFRNEFGRNFKIEEGKAVAYNSDGTRVMSKTNQGEYADAEEALNILTNAHPQKDMILKADGGGGTGNGGGGGQRPGGKYVKRADFEAMTPMKQAETAGAAAKGELSIVD